MPTICLHAISEQGCGMEVWLNGEKCASWTGDTRTYEQNPRPAMGEAARVEEAARKATWRPVYADIRLSLQKDARQEEGHSQETFDSPVTLEIVLTGDVKLCWFRAEDK